MSSGYSIPTIYFVYAASLSRRNPSFSILMAAYYSHYDKPLFLCCHPCNDIHLYHYENHQRHKGEQGWSNHGKDFLLKSFLFPRSDEVLGFCCCSEKFITALRRRFIDAHSTTKEVYYDFVLRSDSDESVPFASIRRFCLFWSYPVPFTNFCSTSSSGCLTKTVWLRTTHATMPVIIIAIMTIIPPIFKIFLMITSLTSKSNVAKTL